MPVQPSDYKLKLVIGIPFSGRYVPPEWALAVHSLILPMNTRSSMVGINCSRHPDGKLTREQARETLADIAIQSKSQYLLMLDDDTEPPPETVVRLLKVLDEHPECTAIGGIYPRRGTGEPMVFLRPNMGCHWTWKVGDIFTSDELEIGTGCLMIRTELFQRLPKPWFRDLNTIDEVAAAGMSHPDDKVDGVERGAMTDDIYFCRTIHRAFPFPAAQIWAHGGVICRHWGRNGDYYEIPRTSYPFASTQTLDKFDPRIRGALTIDGWMSPAELLWLADRAAEHSSIVEIGSWKGRSARCLAENTKGQLVCVDQWEVTPELATEFAAGQTTNGGNADWLYDEFRMNMIGIDNVGALRMSSLAAAVKASENGVRFDMVFIDGGHDYVSVWNDIQAWQGLVQPGGLLCGHDYSPQWPDVTKAVDELVPNRLLVEGTDIWYVNV